MANPEQIRSASDAIRAGDVDALDRLLSEDPELATMRVDGQRTLLHVANDWPGHRPNVARVIAALARHGADVNAPFIGGSHTETPLHWAASNDDVEAVDALLDRGANIEAPGSVIGGGSPMSDAIAFGCFDAARKLLARGAETALWQSAALGLMDRVERHFASETVPPEEITNAFWNACRGGHQAAAEYFLERGADVNWIGHGGLTALETAARGRAFGIMKWMYSKGAKSAHEVRRDQAS